MSPVFSGKFDGSPQHNVDTFTEAFNANKEKYPDLRTLLDGHGTKCGNTNEFASPKPIPSNGVVVFQNPDSGEGFVPSHMGPCEIWLDDTRVFHDDNCAGSFTSKPKAELSVDFSACTGEKCLLQFYWLALHEPTWQVYKNCVPLIGNGGGGNDKVMVANEYSVPSSPSSSPSPSPSSTEYSEYSAPSSSSPSSSPSSTEYSESSEYSTPAPSRRKCHSKQGKRSLRR